MRPVVVVVVVCSFVSTTDELGLERRPSSGLDARVLASSWPSLAAGQKSISRVRRLDDDDSIGGAKSFESPAVGQWPVPASGAAIAICRRCALGVSSLAIKVKGARCRLVQSTRSA